MPESDFDRYYDSRSDPAHPLVDYGFGGFDESKHIQAFNEMVSRGLGDRTQIKETSDESVGDVLSGFAQTALYEAGPGLIGMEPWQDVEDFRRNHPGLTVAAFFLGAAGPYGLGLKMGAKVATKLPGIARVVKFAEGMESPALGKGLKTAAEFTPFELARLGAAAVVPGGDVPDTAEQVLFELPMFGAFDAGLTKLLASRPFKRITFKGEGLISDIFGAGSVEPYYVMETPQARLEMIDRILRNTTSEERAVMHSDLEEALLETRANLERLVVEQVPPQGVSYVSELEQFVGPTPKGEHAPVGRSAAATAKKFKIGRTDVKGGGSTTRKFAPGRKPEYVGSQAEFDRIVKRLGVDLTEMRRNTQYSRVIEAHSDKAAKGLHDFFQPWPWVGRGGGRSYLMKEVDGVFVYAQKVKGRTLQAQKGDQWFLTKTTKPGMFHPEAEKFGEMQIMNAFHHDLEAKLGSEITGNEPLNFVWQLKKALFNRGIVGPETNRVTQHIQKYLTPEQEKLRQEVVGHLRHLKDEFKAIGSPALHEFKDSRMAGTIMAIARAAHARGYKRATDIFYGTVIEGEEKSLYKTLWKGQKRRGGIDAAIDKLSVDELAKIDFAFEQNLSPSEARAKYGIGKAGQSLLRMLNKTDRGYMGETMGIQDLFPDGALADKITPKEWHYMVTRTWRGEYRTPVFEMSQGSDGKWLIDRGAELAGVGSGTSRRAAIEDAKNIVREAMEKDPDWAAGKARIGFREQDTRLVGRDADLALAAQIKEGLLGSKMFKRASEAVHLGQPKRFKQRRGTRGYQTGLTHKELKRIIFGNLIETERINNQRAIAYLLEEEIARVDQMTPRIGERLKKRLNALAGERGNIAQQIDEIFDPFLGPIFGKGAASEIVRKTNHAMFTLMLGIGDLGFATMNTMTPVQTLMPEVAWLLTAPPERIAQYVSPALVLTRNGPMTVRTMDPVRIMGRTFRAMRHPEKEEGDLFHWFTEAMKEGTISPRFVEEFAGKTAGQARFSSVLKGEQGFIEYLQKVSEFLPSISEELSRGYSYTAGFLVGRDYFGLAGKQLHQFATEVTARTNYLYTVADRPRFITGAIGSLFGLFKNWSIHYTANLMTYAGEGAMRGNFAPLLWGTVGTGLLAGVGGLPLYGAADGMSKLLSDKSLVQNTFDMMGYSDADWLGKKAIDSVQYGLPALLGVTLQARAAPTGNSLLRDMQFLFQSATLDRAQALGEAIGDSMEYFRTTGRHPVNSNKIRNAYIRALFPRTLIRAFSRSEDRALVSIKSGNRIMSDMTLPQYTSYILGFTPLDFEKAYEISGAEFARQDKMKAMTSSYGRALAEADAEGDARRATDLLRRAIIDGVDIQSMQRSADAYTLKQNVDVIDRQFDAYRVFQMKKAFGQLGL